MGKKKRSTSNDQTYTYRNGEKVELKKTPDHFVVRSLPQELPTSMSNSRRVSGSSTKVQCEENALEDLMAEARTIAPTHHNYQFKKLGEDFLITDRIIVKFKSAPDVNELGEFLSNYALQVVEEWSEDEFLLRLTNETGMNPVKLVVQLTEDDDSVEYADHDLNFVVRKSQLEIPTDESYARQWHLHQRLQPSRQYDVRSSARCEQAWQSLGNFGNHEVVIGVTDDGCQLDHPDFDSDGKFAGWGYFKGNRLFKRGDVGADPDEMYEDGADHGTSCAGVIAAEVDSEATVGAAPNCRLLPIKWESDGPFLLISDSKLRTALLYMRDRVDVVSNSWGSRPRSTIVQSVRNLISSMAIERGRRNKGVIFLWAAGNENCPVHHETDIDVPYTHGWSRFGTWIGPDVSKEFVNERVGIPNVMHIAALASTAQRSHYSNYGTGIDLTAPSSNSHAYFRMSLPGLGIVTTEGNDAITEEFGGTSSATPLVAGVAGLVISANSELSALEVIQVLKQTASKDLNMEGWPKTRPAPFNMDTSWDVSPIEPFESGEFQEIGSANGTWSPWFGHGRVDALDAVQQVTNSNTKSITVRNQQVVEIPDNEPAGIVSRININDQGAIKDLNIKVNIEHTFRGDLVVNLVSPTGQKVTLHDRQGSSSQDLKRLYTVQTTSALGNLIGSSIHGVWALEIQDLAGIDVGRLLSWELSGEILVANKIEKSSSPGLLIPDDNETGIADSIQVNDARIIENIQVEVDITHTYIGDLRIEIEKEGHDSIILHDQTGSSTQDIRQAYTNENHSELASLVGVESSGQWTLKVFDLLGQDVGKLNRWGVTIT